MLAARKPPLRLGAIVDFGGKGGHRGAQGGKGDQTDFPASHHRYYSTTSRSKYFINK
jgi:hypothetical protein